MPIKGLTTDIEPQFPRLGKLRKGGPKGPSGFGKDLDHFRFTSDRPEIEAAFFEAYGKEPQVLQVYLPHAEALDNFPAWREEWSAGGLVHRCDGETCTISRSGKGYTTKPRPCPYAEQPDDKKNCKPVGRLSVILPALIKAGYVGYVTVETHSKHDLMRITAALQAVGQGAPAGVRGVPFELRRYEAEVSTPGKGDKRARRKKWLVALVPEPTFMECQLQLARQAAYAGLLGPGDVPALPSPDVEDAEFEPATNEPEPEQKEAVNQVTVNWALGVGVGESGKTMADASAGNLRYVLENQDEYTNVQIKAARILSDSGAEPFVERWREEQQNTEPSVEANEPPQDDIPF